MLLFGVLLQDHYDFGMRAVKSVLVMAGGLKRAHPDLPEDVVLIRAMRDSNLPKFLVHDVELFQNIIADLFPGVHVPSQVSSNSVFWDGGCCCAQSHMCADGLGACMQCLCGVCRLASCGCQSSQLLSSGQAAPAVSGQQPSSLPTG